jgi:hypothetical protein
MAGIKKTLLEIVQDILSVMDSEPVNALSDTNEAEQIAEVVESVFYDIVTNRDIPEHYSLIKLTALSDSTKPTHFHLPENVKIISKVWYDKSDDNSFEYAEVYYLEPDDFLSRSDKVQGSYQNVLDVEAGTNLRIPNDKDPEYYTTFDDYHIVMNSFASTKDATLQQSKVRAMGSTFPVFDRYDGSYTPDLDGNMFPYLINEAKSRAMDIFKGGTSQKVEQAARRSKVHSRNDMNRLNYPNVRNDYGR